MHFPRRYVFRWTFRENSGLYKQWRYNVSIISKPFRQSRKSDGIPLYRLWRTTSRVACDTRECARGEAAKRMRKTNALSRDTFSFRRQSGASWLLFSFYLLTLNGHLYTTQWPSYSARPGLKYRVNGWTTRLCRTLRYRVIISPSVPFRHL